jgi:non-ribosomal peptide synthetase component F
VRGRGLQLAKSSDRHEGREVKLSYVHGVGTTPLIADTIGGALNSAAEHWGDRDALVACHQQLRYSYRELRDEADRAARAQIALGYNVATVSAFGAATARNGWSRNTRRRKQAPSS